MTGAALTVIVTVCVLAMTVTAVERGRGGSRELALVAALGAVAAAGRVLTAPIPSVQPVTVICLAAGAALGLRAGLTVGPVAALISNGVLGHGPWTPAQMALWALVGVSGALLAHAIRHPWGFAAVAGAWGVLYGWGMNVWFLAAYGPELSWPAFVASSARSLPFETAGLVGNVLFATVAGAALLRLLGRYAERCRGAVEPSAIMASTRARSSRWLNGLRM